MGRSQIFLLGILITVLVAAVATLTPVQDYLEDISDKLVQMFAPGIIGNDAEVTIVQEERGDRKVCGTCHSDKSNDFKRKYQHAPFVKWQCTDCHVPHNLGTGKYEFVVEVNKLCSTCHFDRKGEMKMSFQHSPFQKGLCTDCHDPHASDYPKQLVVDQQQLCYSCHNVAAKYDLPFKHAPYEKGNCADCHTPHASNGKGLTTLVGKELCFTCHFDRLNELTLPVKHKPYAEGDCTGCHGAHATLGEKLLLLPKDRLCYSCHTDKKAEAENPNTSKHKPFIEAKCGDCHTPHASLADDLLYRGGSELCYMCHSEYRTMTQAKSYHPVGNGLLDCAGCHDPHTGPGPKLTRAKGNDLCYNCHGGLKATYTKLAHNTKAEGKKGLGACLNCHVPHKSDHKPLLMMEQEQTCYTCHGKIEKAAISHPVGPKYKDPWRGGTMHCTSCHGPHGTENAFFTRMPNDGLCLKCHGEKIQSVWKIHKKLDKATW